MSNIDEAIQEVSHLQQVNFQMMDVLRSQLSAIVTFAKKHQIPLFQLNETLLLIRQSGNILDPTNLHLTGRNTNREANRTCLKVLYS